MLERGINLPAYKDEERKTWFVSVRYTDWTGQSNRKVKRGFKREKDALKWERDFLSKETMSCDMPFSALSELYFEDMSTRLRETTIRNKRVLFDTKVLPTFKDMPMNKISAAHIRKWQNQLIKDEGNYAPTYLKTINNQLSAIMNYAVRYYHLPENPCRTAGSMGKKDAEEMEIWTVDEFNKFIAKVDKPGMKLAFEIMFWSGLRVGETIALTPTDILPKKVIDVNKSLARIDGEDKYYDPKTAKSTRQVPIPDFLYDDIQKYINMLYGIKPEDKIFYFTKGTLNKAIKTYSEKANVKQIRVHDLRHSHASMLIELDYNILIISERLGHENVDTTWKTYAHLYPNKQVQLAQEIGKHKNGIIPVSQE